MTTNSVVYFLRFTVVFVFLRHTSGKASGVVALKYYAGRNFHSSTCLLFYQVKSPHSSINLTALFFFMSVLSPSACVFCP